jgi:phosphotriesterase-related protein
MGRRLDITAEVSARTSFNIVCATGLFAEKYGATPYWMNRFSMLRMLDREGDYVRYLADLFMHEIVNGVGPDHIRCGIIKVASAESITDYEMATLRAAAIASIETGVPITTHSDDGLLGREQQRILTELGVPAHRIIIGHSCNTNDRVYHRHIVDHGSYIGFDRFGFKPINSDEARIEALIEIINTDACKQAVISNDTCLCWRDSFLPAAMGDLFRQQWTSWDPIPSRPSVHPFVVTDRILPELRRRGVTEAQINMMLIDNPRGFFLEASQDKSGRLDLPS